MLKLTKEKVKEILTKRVNDCSKEELQAILKLFGLQVKEFSRIEYPKEIGAGVSLSFEVHHRMQYIIEAQTDNSKMISFGNEWVNFGDGSSGAAMGLDNVGDFILIVINLWIDKLRIDYEGPLYDEQKDREYDSMKELSELLDYAKEIMTKKEVKKKTKR